MGKMRWKGEKYEYVTIRLEPISKCKKGTVRAHDVGRKGHAIRMTCIVGNRWKTHSWRLCKDDVTIRKGKIFPKTKQAEKILSNIERKGRIKKVAEDEYVVVKGVI